MSRIAPALMSSASPRAIMQGQPGSNGYWRRQIWDRPGTFTWTATKDGKVKIQAIGAASGASNSLPGNPGHYGEKTLYVVAGQSLTIVVGTGGVGSDANNNLSQAGSTTSISGTPVGGTPLVLPGAPAVNSATNNYGTATVPSGPWDKFFGGGIGSAASKFKGSPASASPFGPGVHADVDSGPGGQGWGGRSRANTGASSHRNGTADNFISAPGRTARGGVTSLGAQVATLMPESLPFWDLEDIDSAGGCQFQYGQSSSAALWAGPGAGGASSSNNSGISSLGGGSGYGSVNRSYRLEKSGNGAGGNGGGADAAANVGGQGGDAYVQLFWDEVA